VAGDVAGGTHCDDLSDDCTMTWHADWTMTCLLTMYTGVMITSCRRHPYPGLTRGSGRLVFGLAHPGEEDVCDAWRAYVRVGSNLAGACRRFRRPISTRFLKVASSLPSLHSGMVKT